MRSKVVWMVSDAYSACISDVSVEMKYFCRWPILELLTQHQSRQLNDGGLHHVGARKRVLTICYLHRIRTLELFRQDI